MIRVVTDLILSVVLALGIVGMLKFVEHIYKVRVFGIWFALYMAALVGLGWGAAYTFYSITNPTMLLPNWPQSFTIPPGYTGFSYPAVRPGTTARRCKVVQIKEITFQHVSKRDEREAYSIRLYSRLYQIAASKPQDIQTQLDILGKGTTRKRVVFLQKSLCRYQLVTSSYPITPFLI
jgi:hypothetical protein